MPSRLRWYSVATYHLEERRISDAFPSSDDYAERAHSLYSQARYDEALRLLREGLAVFPTSAELHVGLGYARLAREEYAWARFSFHEALSLEPNNEDALAGMGEVLMKLGRQQDAFECFDTILALGFREDHDLLLQVGRALFREGAFAKARDFFELILLAHPDSGEGAACMGYAAHRLGMEDVAVRWLRRALQMEPNDVEARIYLGNVLYDFGDYDGALTEFDRTNPEDHFEELALWRYIELKKSMYRIGPRDVALRTWVRRLEELARPQTPDEAMLSRIELTLPNGEFLDPNQLDFFGAQRSDLKGMKQRRFREVHTVLLSDGTSYRGTWEQIVLQILRDDDEWPGGSVAQYMADRARRSHSETGVVVPATDAESFIRGIAAAGKLRITT
ncbi:MAG: tetratricopeptide repeat protein [Gemmatimonadota bacterium]|nr:tetratricopeptide repeat protein [Gemmatimonadota bacterium]